MMSQLKSRYPQHKHTNAEVADFQVETDREKAISQIGRMDLLVGRQDVDQHLQERFGRGIIRDIQRERAKNAEEKKRFEKWEDDNAEMVTRVNQFFG